MSNAATDRWRRVRALFDAALELARPARDAWLGAATRHDDPSVAAEVRAMLAVDAAGANLLDEPPTALLASLAPIQRAAPTAGMRVGPYVLDRRVGRGGMGEVWAAEIAPNVPATAVKLLTAAAGQLRAPERFQQEVRIGMRLAHPHLVPVLDAGETDDGVPWLAMPLVPGETLRDRLARERRLPVRDALRMGGQLAGALAHAHALGVVHRDVTPANVLLDEAGDARLADFGIARALDAAGPTEGLTLVGSIVGTPRYFSPERARGAPPDPRDDVWSLGFVLHELLTGRAPYRGAAHTRVLAGHGVAPALPDVCAERPEIPRAGGAAVQAALAPERAGRADAATLGTRLADALDALDALGASPH